MAFKKSDTSMPLYCSKLGISISTNGCWAPAASNLNFAHCLRPVFFKGQYPLSYAMVGVIPKNGRKGPLPRAQHPVWADSNSAMAIR